MDYDRSLSLSSSSLLLTASTLYKAPEDTLEVKAAKEFHKFAHDVEKSRKFYPYYYHHENPAIPETPAVYYTKLDHFARKNAEVAYKTGFYRGYRVVKPPVHKFVPVYPAGYPAYLY